jgi:hypothetical protein
MSLVRLPRPPRVVAVAAMFAVAPFAAGQNLVYNGGFEQSSVAGGVSGCCEFIEALPAGSPLLPGWALGGAGAELRGRETACLEGPADGGRWLRIGQGFGGGSVSQTITTRAAERHAIRFTRWVESPDGASVPLKISAPGFSAMLFLLPDGPVCTPQVAALTIVEFTAPSAESTIRFETFGGPADRLVLIDSVAVVEAVDCDRDGVLDGFAILDGLVEDLDGDGVPDRCRCRSDFDGDGTVGGHELGRLFGSWGSRDPSIDLDGDGSVGSGDLAILLGDWGDCG